VKWHVIAHHRQPTTVPAQNVDGKLNVAVIISMCRMMPISLDTVPLTTTAQLLHTFCLSSGGIGIVWSGLICVIDVLCEGILWSYSQGSV